jgi:hypothetical protein
MKMVTLPKSQLSQIIAGADQGGGVILTDGDRRVTVFPDDGMDLESDSPELEAELLKAAKGPFKPYSGEEMKQIVQKAIDEMGCK